MTERVLKSTKQGTLRNSALVLFAFATAFFPRLFTSFGAPAVINFAHFGAIPLAFGIAALTTRIRNRQQISIFWEIIGALAVLLTVTVISAFLNDAGIVNIFLQFMFQAEPFLILLCIIILPLMGRRLKNFKLWLLGFAGFNLLLAITQSILMPIGIYPKPQGGTLQDNITGVFGGGGGSAANYVSCTVSIYFAIYFYTAFKTVPKWIRISILLGALYQTQASDSKQVFLGLFIGWILLTFSKFDQPVKLLLYLAGIIIILLSFAWAVQHIESEALAPYQNWVYRDIWGIDGEAAQTILAAVSFVPFYYTNPLNWLFGLGPGHTVTRLGGWVLRDYQSLLQPLGATIHPASSDVFLVVKEGFLAKESTIFFPLFTWAGIWGDLGVVGLASYLYICSIVWRRVCVDDFCKFLLLSTASLGFIITQMEEPGQVLTVAVLIGLRWQEVKEKVSLKSLQKTRSSAS